MTTLQPGELGFSLGDQRNPPKLLKFLGTEGRHGTILVECVRSGGHHAMKAKNFWPILPAGIIPTD